MTDRTRERLEAAAREVTRKIRDNCVRKDGHFDIGKADEYVLAALAASVAELDTFAVALADKDKEFNQQLYEMGIGLGFAKVENGDWVVPGDDRHYFSFKRSSARAVAEKAPAPRLSTLQVQTAMESSMEDSGIACDACGDDGIRLNVKLFTDELNAKLGAEKAAPRLSDEQVKLVCDALQKAFTDPHLKDLNGGEYVNVFSHVAAPIACKTVRAAQVAEKAAPTAPCHIPNCGCTYHKPLAGVAQEAPMRTEKVLLVGDNPSAALVAHLVERDGVREVCAASPLNADAIVEVVATWLEKRLGKLGVGTLAEEVRALKGRFTLAAPQVREETKK